MTAPLRVLIVEDSPTDAKLVASALRQTGRQVVFERVEDAAAMRAALDSKSFDVVISDWSMPHFSGLRALALLRASGIDLPFIIVSGTVGEQVAVEAMRAGAHDYALKDDLTRLAPAVERELRECAVRAEQRRAERALALEQARFRALIEHSEDGIALTGADGVSFYTSPAARRILGLAEDDDRSINLRDVIHPDDLAAAVSARAHLMEGTRAATTAELRIIRPDGSVRWLDVTRTNMLDDPAVGAVVANFRDITEQKRVLGALRSSENRFAKLAESGIIGITVADVLGNLHEANDAYLAMFGYTRDDLASGRLQWDKMTPPEWRESDERAVARLAARGATELWEKELFHKDGRRVPVLIGVTMLDYPYCIAIVSDLTDRKRAELALADAEAQLRQAQKMEAIGRLAGGIAHDFNNLLTVILSHADFALEDLREADPLRGNMSEIVTAGLRAAELTKQLLMFSRRQVLEPTVLDMNEVLTGMDKMLRRVLGEDVRLTCVQTGTLGGVRADRGSIEQVIMNLVVNARDAMPTGGSLTIETGEVLLDEAFTSTHIGMREGPHAMLAVTDTGTGMDRATQARIFEPFFTTKEPGKGTGLGLSTVFGIVQMSGGAIWVYSEVGRGTTFKVYLPRVDGPVTPNLPAPPPEKLRGSETILLVEDEEQVRVVVRDILKRSGYHVVDARNAGEALLHCERDPLPFALLLTDVVMPQMSGPELAKRLAATRPDMKLLCMSGYTDDSVFRHGVLESNIPYIQKPITAESLTRKVREILDAP